MIPQFIRRILARWQASRDSRRWVMMATVTTDFTFTRSDGRVSQHSITWMLFERTTDAKRCFEIAETSPFIKICSAAFNAPVRIWEAGGPMPAHADVRFTRTKPRVFAA